MLTLNCFILLISAWHSPHAQLCLKAVLTSTSTTDRSDNSDVWELKCARRPHRYTRLQLFRVLEKSYYQRIWSKLSSFLLQRIWERSGFLDVLGRSWCVVSDDICKVCRPQISGTHALSKFCSVQKPVLQYVSCWSQVELGPRAISLKNHLFGRSVRYRIRKESP